MERVEFLKSTFFIVFLVLASKECHSFRVPVLPRPLPPPGPLCASQFALVNHACADVLLHPLGHASPQESVAKTSSTPSPSPSPSSPLPSPPLSPSLPNGTRNGHRHRHEGQGYQESLDGQECCRWMNVVDAECVCNLLLHLPSILLRLTHNYTVVVSDSCRVSYQCGGLWKV